MGRLGGWKWEKRQERRRQWLLTRKAMAFGRLTPRAKKIAAEAKPDGILGIRDVATLLKIRTSALRALLRQVSCKRPGQRYAWRASDPCLRSLAALIRAEAARRVRVAGSKRARATADKLTLI